VATINAITRHPAVAASAAAALQVESGGRAVLGVASGYTALAYIGEPYPTPLKVLGPYIQAVRGYLRGQSVDFKGYTSRLDWVPKEVPPVPVEVSGSGPRMIDLAARTADWINVSVGSACGRIAWAQDIIHDALRATGRERSEIHVGAQVAVGVAEDIHEACEGVRSTVFSMAQFNAWSANSDSAAAPISNFREELEGAFQSRSRKDVQHPENLKAWGGRLTDEFVKWFAVVGSPATVADRIRELENMGLDHLYVNFGTIDSDKSFMAESKNRFVGEVMPRLK
jgi:alkanesulfonate monooxygenase SsuD/methylene tetrahydromethanopterin reductase-like flavin-dependent oxidoreductase (luciferase family)